MKSYIYPTATSTSRALIRYIIDMMNREPDRIFYFAFSGGTTPSLMFDIWAHEYREETPWMRMRIFWVDERCVPVNDSDSNYGTMFRLLLSEVGMPDEFVFPICGTCRHPSQEAKRYSDLVCSTVPLRRGFPAFDMVLLGAGDDGHTSSIFPGQEYLLSSFQPYEESINPYNGQPRIAMTGCLLFSAKKIVFLITGKGKAGVVGIGLQQGGIADTVAVFIGLVNGDMVVDGRAAGGGGIPGHVITAVNTLVAGTGSITAFDFQPCGGIRGAVVQDIAVVALEHLIGNIFLAGLVVTVDVVEEEQDLADIADIPFLRHRILGQILGIRCKDITHRRSFREALARQGGNIRAALFYSLHRDDRSAIV